MLTIVADEIGRHDLLYTPCSMEMYPASTCNAGADIMPLGFEILG